MTTTIEHDDHTGHSGAHDHDGNAGHDGAAHDEAAHDDHHKSTRYWITVAFGLAALTGLETSTYWFDFGKAFMPMLLTLMVIKFVVVVSLFMHLRFDNKLFSWLFYAGLLLAVFVYVAALLTFRFFGST